MFFKELECSTNQKFLIKSVLGLGFVSSVCFPFLQLLVILVEELEGVHPAIYALLPDKTRVTYDRMWRMIENLRPQQFNPDRVSCDFEEALFNSVTLAYPNANIDGCFFHFVKNFYKHIVENQLKDLYVNDAQFALTARMIPALAFVPPNDLDIVFAALQAVLPANLTPILQWLENNYLGRRVGRQGNRRQPTFPIEMWNVHERVVNHIGRTNNYAEAAHRRVQLELKTTHPTVWKLITDLKTIQKGRDAFYESLVAGNPPPKKLQRYIDCDNRILRIVGNYQQYQVKTEFLRGIAHNFMM